MSGSFYKLISEGPLSRDARIVDLETGKPLHMVKWATARLAVDQVNEIECGLICVGLSVGGALKLCIEHPLSGETKEVDEIVFSDGERLKVEGGRVVRVEPDGGA